MKLLVALAVIQTAALAFLGFQILGIDERADEIAGTAAAMRAEPAQSAGLAAVSRPADPFGARGATADEIRQIVREEIAALRDANPAAAYAATDDPPDVVVEADAQRLRESVRQDLDAYMRRGKIGEAEMADLQMKIAGLPAEQRREMLRELTKAMNSGGLDARL